MFLCMMLKYRKLLVRIGLTIRKAFYGVLKGPFNPDYKFAAKIRIQTPQLNISLFCKLLC